MDELLCSSRDILCPLEMEDEADTCSFSLSVSESLRTGDAAECERQENQSVDAEKKPRIRPAVYRCSYPNCEKEYPRKYRLERHQRSHSNEKPFICTIGDCDKSFVCKSYLVKHMRRPHESLSKTPENMPKIHKCSECGKVFKHKFDLKTHSAVHGGEKPFKCTICSETFALRGRLKKHTKKHEGYSCIMDNCDFVGETWSTLQKHISVEHKKLFKCDFCDREYHSANKLKAHAVVHEQKQKQYRCTYDDCDRSYSRKSNLLVHIKAVHSNITYKCDHAGCDHEVHYKASHIRHMKTHEQNRASRVNLGTTKSMASVLSQFEITKEQNTRILKGEILADSEVNGA